MTTSSECGAAPSAAARRGGSDKGRPAVLPFLLAAALLVGGGTAAQGAPAASEEQLAAEIRSAVTRGDLPALEGLVNWEGAGKMRRRMVSYQLRHTFRRPIRSFTVEPFPADGFKEIEQRGTLKANMAVTKQVRVVFDEPDTEFGKPPTEFFLIGKHGDEYKIALVVPTRPPGGGAGR